MGWQKISKSFHFKRYPTCYESYTLGIIRTVYVSGREDGVWQFSVCASIGLDGTYTLPINHKTVTAKVPMTSDEENVLRNPENQDVKKKRINLWS
jgi:hypothetical protein